MEKLEEITYKTSVPARLANGVDENMEKKNQEELFEHLENNVNEYELASSENTKKLIEGLGTLRNDNIMEKSVKNVDEMAGVIYEALLKLKKTSELLSPNLQGEIADRFNQLKERVNSTIKLFGELNNERDIVIKEAILEKIKEEYSKLNNSLIP